MKGVKSPMIDEERSCARANEPLVGVPAASLPGCSSWRVVFQWRSPRLGHSGPSGLGRGTGLGRIGARFGGRFGERFGGRFVFLGTSSDEDGLRTTIV